MYKKQEYLYFQTKSIYRPHVNHKSWSSFMNKTNIYLNIFQNSMRHCTKELTKFEKSSQHENVIKADLNIWWNFSFISGYNNADQILSMFDDCWTTGWMDYLFSIGKIKSFIFLLMEFVYDFNVIKGKWREKFCSNKGLDTEDWWLNRWINKQLT